MTKLNIQSIAQEAKRKEQEIEFNKTLFIPKSSQSYILTLDLNNVETEEYSYNNKEGVSKTATRYLFSNVLVNNVKYNYRVFSDFFNKVLALKPTEQDIYLKVVVVYNDKGYVESIERYKEGVNSFVSDSLDDIETIDLN